MLNGENSKYECKEALSLSELAASYSQVNETIATSIKTERCRSKGGCME